LTQGAPDFDPAALKGTLPEWPADPQRPLSADERAYLRFYGLDFASETKEAKTETESALAGVSHAWGLLPHASERLLVHFWQPAAARGTVSVLHGYFDHVGLYRHLIRHLLEQGYAVMAFDLPGHGLSTGEPAIIDDFADYVAAFECCQREVASLGPEPRHIIGQSTGAAVAMEWALAHGYRRDSAPFEGLVLLAPLVRPARWALMRWLYYLIRLVSPHRTRRFRDNSGDSAFVAFIRDSDPLQSRHVSARWVRALMRWMQRFVLHQPTDITPLVIQGRQDATVDWHYNLSVIQRLFRARIHYLPDARHHLVNESPTTRAELLTILTTYLTSTEPTTSSPKPR
jgi:alpha-beta hydrolase superfamily lysophospholipase